MLRAAKPSFAFDMQSICRMVSVRSRAKRASHGDDSLGVQGTQTDIRLQQQSSGTRPFCLTWWHTAVQGDPHKHTTHTHVHVVVTRSESDLSFSSTTQCPWPKWGSPKENSWNQMPFLSPFLTLSVCVCVYKPLILTHTHHIKSAVEWCAKISWPYGKSLCVHAFLLASVSDYVLIYSDHRVVV